MNTELQHLINNYKAGKSDSAQIESIRSIVYEMQNEAFTMADEKREYKQSLKYIDSAIAIWTTIKDTANIANILKYKGLVLGYLGHFAEAKREIGQAITLFTSINRKYGVAVSKFDLSKVYELESKLDSAIIEATSSYKYWTTTSNTGRIVNVSNQLINLYIKTNQFKNAEDLQRSSGEMINENVYWRDALDFYYLSSRLFRATGVKEREKNFVELYNKKRAENGNVGSAYE